MFRSVFGRRDEEERIEKEGRLPPGQSLTNRFPVLHYGPVPRFNPATWSLRIFGEVEQEITWTWDEFNQACPARKSRWISTASLAGASSIRSGKGSRCASLSTSRSSSSNPTARHLMQHCEYGFTVNIPLEVALAPNFLLATHYNGEPLEPDHGYPLRGVVGNIPGSEYMTPYFWKGGKWIRGLEFMANDRLGFWEQAGYHNRADVWDEERFA